MRVSEVSLETDHLLKVVAEAIETEADKVIHAISEREKRIKRFTQFAKKPVLVRSSPLSKSLPTTISEDRTNKKGLVEHWFLQRRK